jgi:hypothetical protein
MKAKKYVFFVPFFFCLLIFIHKASGISDITVNQWHSAEITLVSDKVYSNPLTEVEVSAVFSKAGSPSVLRPIFWDGGKIWKVRFSPPSTGTWKMLTTSTDASNSGLHRQLKTIKAKQFSSDLPIYKHGFLKVSKNGHYFTHMDGTPFFYLGDTHAMAMHERWNNCNHVNCSSQFKYEADKRLKQGFTVWQTEWMKPHGNNHTGMDEEPFYDTMTACKISSTDLPGFRNIDKKISYLANKGYVIAAAIEWRLDALHCSNDFLAKYGRYWAGRYGAYPMLWTVAQEADGLYPNDPPDLNIKWQIVGKSLSENDGYSHPLTAHMIADITPKSSNWAKLAYHNWYAAQIHENINHEHPHFIIRTSHQSYMRIYLKTF